MTDTDKVATQPRWGASSWRARSAEIIAIVSIYALAGPSLGYIVIVLGVLPFDAGFAGALIGFLPVAIIFAYSFAWIPATIAGTIVAGTAAWRNGYIGATLGTVAGIVTGAISLPIIGVKPSDFSQPYSAALWLGLCAVTSGLLCRLTRSLQ